MSLYKEMYYMLCKDICSAIILIEQQNIGLASEALKEALCKTEDFYIQNNNQNKAQ